MTSTGGPITVVRRCVRRVDLSFVASFLLIRALGVLGVLGVLGCISNDHLGNYDGRISVDFNHQSDRMCVDDFASVLFLGIIS